MSANPNVRTTRCACGSWECGTRCRFDKTGEDAVNRYAEAKIREQKLRGYPAITEREERAPDGRRLYP